MMYTFLFLREVFFLERGFLMDRRIPSLYPRPRRELSQSWTHDVRC